MAIRFESKFLKFKCRINRLKVPAARKVLSEFLQSDWYNKIKINLN